MGILEDIQAASAKHYLKAAEFFETKATYDALASKEGFHKAEAERKTAELLHRRVQNASRPSIYLGAHISHCAMGYCAAFGELTAYGDTPEQAFDNFDRLWVQGSNNDN